MNKNKLKEPKIITIPFFPFNRYNLRLKININETTINISPNKKSPIVLSIEDRIIKQTIKEKSIKDYSLNSFKKILLEYEKIKNEYKNEFDKFLNKYLKGQDLTEKQKEKFKKRKEQVRALELQINLLTLFKNIYSSQKLKLKKEEQKMVLLNLRKYQKNLQEELENLKQQKELIQAEEIEKLKNRIFKFTEIIDYLESLRIIEEPDGGPSGSPGLKL